MAEKERIQFDFAPEAVARLDALQEMTGATSRAEVVRRAIRVYEFMVKDADPKGSIKIFGADGELDFDFKVKLLLN